MNAQGMIKTIFVVIAICLLTNKMAFSQRGGGANNTQATVYTNVDRMPEYPGGEEAITKFIKANMKYPVAARAKKITGKVYTEFVVNERGEIETVEILRNLEPTLDAEAVRLVKSLKGWKPGKNLGKPVKVSMVLPVEFEL
jgi:TonB family protein